jgi:integrase
MARLKNQNKKNHWVVHLQSLGHDTCFTTGKKNKADAKAIIRCIENRVAEVKIDGNHLYYDWTKKEQRQWLLTGKVPTAAGSGDPLELEKAIELYLEQKRAEGIALTTIEQYERELGAVIDFFGNIRLQRLTAPKLQEFVNHLAKTRIVTGRNRGSFLDPETQKRKVIALKRVVKWHRSLGEPNLDTSAFDAVSYAIRPEKITSELTKWTDFESRIVELERLGISPDVEGAFAEIIYTKCQLDEHLEYLRNKLFIDGTVASTRLYCAVLFANATGCRRSELTRVRRRDFILDEETPLVTITKRKGRAGNAFLRQKSVLPHALLPPIRRLLNLLPTDQDCLFTASDDHLTTDGWDEEKERDKARYLTEEINNALAGSKWEKAAAWHIYRHTLASKLLVAGYSQIEVKEMVGWCSDEMAKRYQHLHHSRKSEIINSVF